VTIPQFEQPDGSTNRGWRARFGSYLAVLVVVVVAGSVFLANRVSMDITELPAWGAWGASIFFAFFFVATPLIIADRFSHSARETAKRYNEAFYVAAERAVVALESTLPASEPNLEDEIADVSASLSQTVTRLRQISNKAEAFEVEVRALVNRAEVAKATASLYEDDARKIALLLGRETEERFRAEIAKLAEEHNRQTEELRKSGNRMALWTFVGGVALGVVGNIVVALMMR
jgi:hypothetical protein